MHKSEWALEKLEEFRNPQELFLNLCDNLSKANMAESLVKSLAERVVFGLPVNGTIKLTAVEHPETLDDPGQKEITFLGIRIYDHRGRAGNILFGPPTKDNPPYESKFWKDFSHIQYEDLVLFGSFNTSVWENDKYRFEGVEDEKLLDKLVKLPCCLIENTVNQWVVKGEKNKKLWLVTGSLHREGGDTFDLTAVDAFDVGEAFLRLLCARVFGEKTKTAVGKDFTINTDNKKAPVQFSVDLKNCNLASSSYQWASFLSQDTRILNISRNDLSDLPHEIRGLKNLEELDLSHNNFNKIPEWIGELKCLKKLDISMNPLVQLPEGIGFLEKIERIYCVNTQIVNLPDDFGNLKTLEILQLGNNKLVKLPDSFGKLEKLKSLDLETNCLDSLPDTFGRLSSLETLVLSHNPMDFPSQLCRLKELKSLKFDGAQVSQIPEDIAANIKLETLTLTKNKITKLPDSLLKLPLLKTLIVNGNRIEALPDISCANNLVWLYMSDNVVEKLPEKILIPNAMKEITLSGNKLESFPIDSIQVSNLKYIDLSKNPIGEELRTDLSKLGGKVKL